MIFRRADEAVTYLKMIGLDRKYLVFYDSYVDLSILEDEFCDYAVRFPGAAKSAKIIGDFEATQERSMLLINWRNSFGFRVSCGIPVLINVPPELEDQCKARSYEYMNLMLPY